MLKFLIHLCIALFAGWVFSNHWAHAQYDATHKRVPIENKVKVIAAIAIISVFCAYFLCKPATYAVLLIIIAILQVVSYNRVRMWNTLTMLFTGYMIYSIAMRWDAIGKPDFKLLLWLIAAGVAILVAVYKTVVDRFFINGFVREKHSGKEAYEASRKTRSSEKCSGSMTTDAEDDDEYDDDDEEFDETEDPVSGHVIRWIFILILVVLLVTLCIALF